MSSPDRHILTTRRDALFAAYESALGRLGVFTGFVEARSLAQINPEERARMNYAREQLNALRFERVNFQRAEMGQPQLEKPKPFPTTTEEAIAAAASKPSPATAGSNGAGDGLGPEVFDTEHVTVAAEDSAGDGA